MVSYGTYIIIRTFYHKRSLSIYWKFVHHLTPNSVNYFAFDSCVTSNRSKNNFWVQSVWSLRSVYGHFPRRRRFSIASIFLCAIVYHSTFTDDINSVHLFVMHPLTSDTNNSVIRNESETSKTRHAFHALNSRRRRISIVRRLSASIRLSYTNSDVFVHSYKFLVMPESVFRCVFFHLRDFEGRNLA